MCIQESKNPRIKPADSTEQRRTADLTDNIIKKSKNTENSFNNVIFFFCILRTFPLFFRPVSNASEVMQIISSVLKLRAHCPTLVHADSSRSHLIVTLTVSSKSPNAVALGEMHVWEFIEDLFQ